MAIAEKAKKSNGGTPVDSATIGKIMRIYGGLSQQPEMFEHIDLEKTFSHNVGIIIDEFLTGNMMANKDNL